MELTVKFIFSEDWDNDCNDLDAELIAEDAIRELAGGVGYEIIGFKRGEAERPNEAVGLHLHDVMASALAINEDFQKQLLNRWGFTEDGSIDVKNQLKIFAVLDWIKKNGNPQHLP